MKRDVICHCFVHVFPGLYYFVYSGKLDVHLIHVVD